MKKILLLTVTLLTVFILAACRREVPSALTCLEEGGGPLKVGMNLVYPPFEMRDDENQPVGISVDIAKAFGEYIGCEVEIVNVDFANLIDALNLGDIDLIIASMSRTAAREELITFSEPYMYFKIIGLANQAFADTHGLNEDSTVEDVLAITSARFVGIAGQVSYTLPIQLGVNPDNVSQSTDLASAAESVVFGDNDILMMSASPVVRNHLVNPDTTMVLWDPFQSSPIAMGMRHGEDELLALANAFIATMNEDGGLYDQLRADWDETILAILDRYGIDFFLLED